MRRVAIAFISCALLHPCRANAQSGAPFDFARTSSTSVHRYVANDAIPRQLALPPNLIAPGIYRPLVESMLSGSSTFRRQCMRIAAEPGLTVQLVIGWVPVRTNIRAMTTIKRTREGQLSALVQIGRKQNVEELIAHEIEHIIEQLDGVDLAAYAGRRGTGVVAVGYSADMFETTRAKRAGVKVSSELRR
jgi:hypothetical protein